MTYEITIITLRGADRHNYTNLTKFMKAHRRMTDNLRDAIITTNIYPIIKEG